MEGEEDFKAESSVITSVAHMQPRSDIQTKEELAPSKWQIFTDSAKTSALNKIREQEKVYEKEFIEIRYTH